MNAQSAVSAVADCLERHADDMVTSWIEWVQQRVPTETISALPDQALRNHIPPVLQSLSRYVRHPIEIVREELLSHLRLHGHIRRDQGYSLKEVLAEFDGLASIVTTRANEAVVEHAPDAPIDDVLEATTRLATGLRSVSYIAMGTYSDSADTRRHSIASGLEEFARAIGHELRNPLNTLTLGLAMFREGGVDAPSAGQHIDAMEAAVKRTTNLIDTIHSLAVAEEARAGEQLVGVDEAIRRIVSEVSERADAVGVEIRVVDSLPDVKVEAILAYIVLINLIGNAIKYSDPAKDDAYVDIGARVLEEENDSGFVEVSVADNGLGIPEELISRVVQRGFRAHPDHAQGTGLGLHLVQRSLTDRGGGVTITSAEGEGTTVLAKMRCLQVAASALTAERFRVEHLMGTSLWREAEDDD